MDVSCPRCHTEYEFEEARIPDDGLTLKCTQCGHVFRVKRQTEVALPPPPIAREWKIRKRSTGTISTCRELTSLQQWIIERKVSRDDEISLTGETWKRLGDIPELASFFQVVDDAARGRSVNSNHGGVKSASVPVPPPPPPPSTPTLTETWRAPSFKTPMPPATVEASPSGLRTAGALHESAVPKPLTSQIRPRRDLRPDEEREFERVTRRPSRRWPLVILFGTLLGAAVAWFFAVYQPGQERRAAEDEARTARENQQRHEMLAALKPLQALAPMLDAGAAVENADAGAEAAIAPLVLAPEKPAPDPAPEKPAPEKPAPEKPAPEKPVKAEPKLDFDALQARGDALLLQEKPEAALSLFGKAADLRPGRVEPMVGRGLALLDMGNTAAAEAAFEQAIKLNSRYGPAIMGLAEANRLQGKYDKATEWYQRYLDLLPNGNEANVARNNIERLKR